MRWFQNCSPSPQFTAGGTREPHTRYGQSCSCQPIAPSHTAALPMLLLVAPFLTHLEVLLFPLPCLRLGPHRCTCVEHPATDQILQRPRPACRALQVSAQFPLQSYSLHYPVSRLPRAGAADRRGPLLVLGHILMVTTVIPVTSVPSFPHFFQLLAIVKSYLSFISQLRCYLPGENVSEP